MSFRNRLAVFIGVVLVAAALTALLAPFVVPHGVRAWLWWAARHEGVTVEVGKIRAPFLRAVEIDGLHILPAKEKAREIDLRASQVTLDLNFRGWLFSQRARFLRSIAVEHLSGSIRQGATGGGDTRDWRNLRRLLPDEFRFREIDLDVVTGATAFTFRGVSLSASEVESGKFSAHKIFITSPILRQTFTELRGATSWGEDRLTIAGVSLVRGLDLEALTIDLSSLTKRRVGLDLQLDAFGGTLRASLQGQGGGKKFAIDLAATAANVSLAQVSKAAGFLEPLTGSVRASKFTFRGNPGEFLDATASVWIELADFAWRARRADHVVFGATYYDRRLQIEQLYLQQERNELTVNGELRWPKRPIGWTALPFRGELSASLPDANAFAQLFGAKAGDFSGALSANGEIDSLDPSAHGRLNFRGEGVRFRGVALDSLGGTMQLHGSEATLESLELRHGDDFLRAHGTANLTAAHRYSVRLTGAINDLSDYALLLPKSWRPAAIGGGITFDWNGDGTMAAHSGTMQLFAHGLQLPVAPLRSPLDVTLEGTYSPQDIFFRTFKLANDRISLGGFLMLGSNFIELQALELMLDGAPRIEGTLFLPFGVDRWRKSGSLLVAFDERQKFDVDLAVERLDLGQISAALGEKAEMSGVLDGKLAAYGPLASLQVTTDGRLEDLGPSPAKNSIAFDLRYGNSRADANFRAIFGVSAPLGGQISLPLRLEKPRLADGSFIAPTEPFSFTLDCPALFLAMMPERLRPPGASSGLVTGKIDFANTFRNPQISGGAQLFDLKMKPAPPWPEVTDLVADLHFGNSEAAIPLLRFTADGMLFDCRGSLTTSPPTFALTFAPVADTISLARLPENGSEISAVRVLGEAIVDPALRLQKAVVRGTLGSPAFSLTIDAVPSDAVSTQTTLFFDPQAATTAGPLLLNVAAPERAAPALEMRKARP